MSFEVTSYADLKKVGTGVDGWNLDSDYIQTADIDASASATENTDGSGGYYGFSPIGGIIYNFTGTYDGGGYKISNLYIHRFTLGYVGLFGYASLTSDIHHLGVVNSDFTGYLAVGGFVGHNAGTISNCYSSGSVNDFYNYAGGFVGYNAGTISNCYSSGSVNGLYNWFGGFVGYNIGTATNCYSTGGVSGDNYVGGFVGYNRGTATNCYWDTQTSGQATSDGGTGLTTAQMTYPYSGAYSGWNFETIWANDEDFELNDGYPILAVFYSKYIVTYPATDITYDGTKLKGKAVSDGSADIKAYFEYRIKGNESWTATSKLDIATTQPFEITITGLDGLKVYEFRAVLEESSAPISYGLIREFTTLSEIAADEIISLPIPISLKVTKEINGFWGGKMACLPDPNIDCENYIDIDDEKYVVKILEDIKSSGKHYQNVELYHNAIEELSALTVDRISKLDTVENHLTTILTGSEWTAGDCDIDETVFLITDKRVSVLEALTQLATISGGELYYHSLTRVVDLKRQIGTETGLHLRYDKNSTYISRIKDSTNLITRIYPYGADNYTINTTILDDCEDESLYSASGGGTLTASTTIKMYGSMGIQINSSTLNETFIRDLAGNTVDLTDHTSLKFWIYSEVANANGFTFGIGESAYTENTVNTGALSAMSWKEVTLDLSSVADGDKDAIRYIGFKNLTGSAVEVVFDSIRAFDGNIYIESDNASHYKVKKEYVYQHSGKPEKTVFEKILYPTHDAYTSSAAPNSNFNSLVMGVQAGTVWNTFLKWDFTQIPADATIESATLYLTQYQGSGTLSAATTQLCAADWDENTITYNNQPTTSGASFHTWDFRSTGTINDSGDILTTVQNWFNSVTNNYGITIRTASGRAELYSKNVHVDGAKPQLKIKYSLTTDPEPIIKAGAMEKLYANDEPALMYKVKAADLSKVIADTWEDETIELGDTVKIYDYDLKDDDGNPLNVSVRIKKITKNLLDPSDMDIELANKSYSIVNENAELLKKLSYAMPFADKPNVVSANAVQAGYTGGEVNV